jgi:hypothetical protein
MSEYATPNYCALCFMGSQNRSISHSNLLFGGKMPMHGNNKKDILMYIYFVGEMQNPASGIKKGRIIVFSFLGRKSFLTSRRDRKNKNKNHGLRYEVLKLKFI